MHFCGVATRAAVAAKTPGPIENRHAADTFVVTQATAINPDDFKVAKHFVPIQLFPVCSPDVLAHIHIRKFPACFAYDLALLISAHLGKFPGCLDETEILVLLPEPVGR